MVYHDPRLVALYDLDNPDGPDHDFYRSLADEVGASSILDLGCGTGLLTTSLARDGRTVVGIDPSENMLAFARKQPNADAVQWVHGDSSAIPAITFDLAVMTGNVAQHIEGAGWHRTLRDIRNSMRSGGSLAFESRNPLTRAWDAWTSPEKSIRETSHGQLVEWMVATETSLGTVRIEAFNVFSETEEQVVDSFDLTFRTRDEIEADLEATGFEISSVSGDWNRTTWRATDPTMVFVARAR